MSKPGSAIAVMASACVVLLALVGAGCAAEPEAELRFALASAAAPRYGTTPFPSDLYRGADGRLLELDGMEDITPLSAEVAAAHWLALDGFGVRPVVELFATGALEPASVPRTTDGATDVLRLVDVDPASPARGRGVPMEWRWDEARQRIAGVPRPGTVLRDGTRYAVVARRGLRDAGGRELVPAAAFTELLAQDLDALAPALRDVRQAVGELAARGTAPSDLLVAATFTTQRATAALLAAREVAAAAPAPTLAFPDDELVFRDAAALDALLGVPERDETGKERWGWSNPTGMAHDHVGVIATGVMTAPRFLTPDDGSFLPHADAFRYDEDGRPVAVEEAASLPVTFVLPATPPPPEGYPVAIFGHGLGASRHQVLALAEPLCAQGWALAAIDHNAHGSRFRATDERNNNAELLSAFNGDPTLRDGLGDVVGVGSTFAFLHELKNLSAMRDSIRQSALDQGALARLLRAEPDLSALAPAAEAPGLNGDRVVYLGESFGGVVGSVLAAIEPELDLFVLDVPGGGIFDLTLLGSPTMRPLIELWLRSTYGIDERLDRFHPVIGLGQAVLDGGDPLSFAPHVLRDRLAIEGRELSPRHVVLLEVVGDEILPNRATHALARAFGTPLLEPYAVPVAGLPVVAGPQHANVDGQTAALVQWSPATHGSNWTSERGVRKFAPFGEGDDEEYQVLDESVTIDNPMRATLAQVTAVLESYAQGAPTVPASQIARPDFDDDGMTDEDERAQGRDPLVPDA